MVGRRCTCLHRQLNSCQGTNSSQAESSQTRRLQETRCTTGYNKFHNLCRDHYDITAPPLDCARSGDFAHDLLSRHKKERFHHNISDIVSQYSADSFMIAIEIPLCSCLPGQVLFLAPETLFTTSPRSLSRTRLHDHFSGDPFYTTIALQPIVSAATTISHTNTQRPYQKTTAVLFNAVVLGSMSCMCF